MPFVDLSAPRGPFGLPWKVAVVVGCCVTALLGVGIWRWNESSYNDIRSAADAYEPPSSRVHESTELSGSKRFSQFLWSSDTREAVLEFSTTDSGVEACRHAVESLQALAPGEEVVLTTERTGDGYFCSVDVTGDFQGISRGVIWVWRQHRGDRELSAETASAVTVSLYQEVQLRDCCAIW